MKLQVISKGPILNGYSRSVKDCCHYFKAPSLASSVFRTWGQSKKAMVLNDKGKGDWKESSSHHHVDAYFHVFLLCLPPPFVGVCFACDKAWNLQCELRWPLNS